MVYILIATLVMLLALAIPLIFTWAVTAGVVWLICLCFGWEFTWGIATGVWVIVMILGAFFIKD